MQRTTRSSHDARPRPMGRSFWLLATMVTAAIVVIALGNAFAASDTTQVGQYSSQELLDLADTSTGADPFFEGLARPSADEPPRSAPADPASPAVSAAPPSTLADTPPSTVNSAPTTPPTTPTTAASTTTATPATSTPTTSTPATSTPTTPTTSSTTSASAPAPVSEAPAELVDTPTDIAAEQPPSVQARGEAALAAISYPWRQILPEWQIEFLPERSGLYGLTMVQEHRIEVYVRDSQPTELLSHVIAHELGHAVDVSLNDGPDRRRWEEARGLSPAPWWPGSAATDFSTGAGDFAESFAAWQVGDRSFRSRLAGAPSPEQIELLAELSAG